MNPVILQAVKQVLKDRLMALLLILVILVALAYSVYVGISLQPSDVQVAVHYTAFGETNFYREKWYYLVSFILFGLVVATIHTAIAIKLHFMERRQFAVAFSWLSILLIVIAWAVTHSVLRIAFL